MYKSKLNTQNYNQKYKTKAPLEFEVVVKYVKEELLKKTLDLNI